MSRLQLALSVADLQESMDFYIKVFGVQPHKVREGYANFEIAEPPLKLVLIEVGAEARGHGAAGALNHLGVEELTAEAYGETRARIDATGLVDLEEADTTCCYAVQDKVWLHDPSGTPWEFYVITEDNPELVLTGSAQGEDAHCCS
ncbi:MAG: VOC family protein [Candidatus Nanopelagicales bacterium]|nr:VOC family protein [Candidatus Nanopelagicales bacterium]